MSIFILTIYPFYGDKFRRTNWSFWMWESIKDFHLSHCIRSLNVRWLESTNESKAFWDWNAKQKKNEHLIKDSIFKSFGLNQSEL